MLRGVLVGRVGGLERVENGQRLDVRQAVDLDPVVALSPTERPVDGDDRPRIVGKGTRGAANRAASTKARWDLGEGQRTLP